MATKNWLDGTADWYTPADWTGGTIPASGDDVVITTGAPFLQTGDAAITVNSITLSATLQLNGTARLAVSGDLADAGTLVVDNGIFGGGGSSLAIGQILSNSGTVSIGNTGLATATTVTATGLSNTGTINLFGSATKLATLNILGPAPATLGNVNLFGDALLQFASGAVSGIAAGTTFSMSNDPTPSRSIPAASPTPPSATPALWRSTMPRRVAAFPATPGAAAWRSARS